MIILTSHHFTKPGFPFHKKLLIRQNCTAPPIDIRHLWLKLSISKTTHARERTGNCEKMLYNQLFPANLVFKFAQHLTPPPLLVVEAASAARCELYQCFPAGADSHFRSNQTKKGKPAALCTKLVPCEYMPVSANWANPKHIQRSSSKQLHIRSGSEKGGRKASAAGTKPTPKKACYIEYG